MPELKPPSSWIERYLSLVRPAGRVLDVACGSGRHVAAASRRGFSVTGIDRDISRALVNIQGPGVELLETDLEAGNPWPFEPESFDAVIVANYLWRPLIPDLVATLTRSGVLIYETFAIGNERFGKPSNPNFLLRPGELIDAVSSKLVPLAYEHARLRNPDRIVQRICALGPDHKGLSAPPNL